MRPAAITDFLAPDAMVSGLEADGKKQLLQALAAKAASGLGLGEHVLFDVLWEREQLGTTGVGSGIAIPHGRVPGLEKVCGFFAQLATPVSFDAVDGKPVDLVFLLMAPVDAGADHLHALATVSRTLRDTSLCDKLRAAKDAKALRSLLDSVPPVEAA